MRPVAARRLADTNTAKAIARKGQGGRLGRPAADVQWRLVFFYRVNIERGVLMPRGSIAGRTHGQEHSIEIERRFEEALVKSEVLFTNLGPNRFDAIGKVALFGRCFMFMDAQDPSVVLIERRTCES